MTTDQYSISITKQQVAELPTVEFPGAITLIETRADLDEAVRFLRTQKIVGFDTETKPSFRKGQVNKVSLIQISTADHCYLIRLNKTGFTESLREFMECKDLVKVGLSLKDDFHVLHRTAPFEPVGFVDLQDMVKDYAIADASLQKIYAILCGGRISKSQRLTNWEAPALTPQQMIYASIDAWACLRIYRLLTGGEFNPADSPYKVYPETEEE